MSVKLIIWNLDGVLVNSRDMHYEALNRALKSINPRYVISRVEDSSTYGGLPTTKKLKMLSDNKGLPTELHSEIWKRKQENIWKIIDEEYTYEERIRQILEQLKRKGYTLYITSNCVYNSMKIILNEKGFIEYIDYFISTEDVTTPKTNPEIYQICMIRAGVTCNETVIIEESHNGHTTAINSGAMCIPIENPGDVNLTNIEEYINKYTMTENKSN